VLRKEQKLTSLDASAEKELEFLKSNGWSRLLNNSNLPIKIRKGSAMVQISQIRAFVQF
jgi:hypothetical protein